MLAKRVSIVARSPSTQISLSHAEKGELQLIITITSCREQVVMIPAACTIHDPAQPELN